MRRLLALSIVGATVLVACHAKPHERLTVAVSISPLYDLVGRIAGPDADVALVLPAGASPQAWTVAMLSPDVAARVAGARCFVSVGLGLDTWMDRLEAQAPPKSRVLKLGDRVPTVTTGDGAIDPYVWMDPQRARLMAIAIAEDLARADSSHAGAFRERAAALDASLAALDKEIETRVATWPKHEVPALPPSMAYFAERYGLHAANGPGAVAASPADHAPRVSAFRAGDAGDAGDTNVGTYEDLIRFDTTALELSVR